MPIIDAHHHLWQLSKPAPFDYAWLAKPEHAAIHRDFLPEDLKPKIDAVGVTHTVFVQTQHHPEENRWVLRLADENPWIVGVVGWVDLQSPAVTEQILDCKRHPKFVGVRHITQDEPDDNFIIRSEVLRGLKALEKQQVPFDLLFFVKHLKHAPTVARAVPDLPLVIDHLAKPKIKTSKLRRLAAAVSRRGGMRKHRLQTLRHGDGGRLEALEARRSTTLYRSCFGIVRARAIDVRQRLAGK